MDKKFLGLTKIGVFTGIATAVVVSIFNIAMDPYLEFGMPRIAGFNAWKPTISSQERLMKAHEVLRAVPNTLILGSSPNDWGLDGRDPAWPAQARPVYNLSLMMGNPYTSYRYLQHTITDRPVSLVVLGLNTNQFLTSFFANRPTEPEFESRLAVTREGVFNVEQSGQSTRDLVIATLSLDALTDSFETLAANLKGPSFGVFNSVDGNLDLNPDRSVGTYRSFMFTDLFAIRFHREKRRSQFVMAMEDVRAILDLCKSRGSRVILLINPVHADVLEILDHLGYWPAFEDWKRALVALTAEYSGESGRRQVSLWDFSGFDSYSTETVPADGQPMRWYTDSLHFTRALGNLIIRRISESGDPNFGVLLTHENLESHLAVIREQQRLYRERQPLAVRRVRDLYDAAVNIPPRFVVTQVQ